MTKAGCEPKSSSEPTLPRPHCTFIRMASPPPASPTRYIQPVQVGRANLCLLPKVKVTFKSRSVFPEVEFAHIKGLWRRGERPEVWGSTQRLCSSKGLRSDTTQSNLSGPRFPPLSDGDCPSGGPWGVQRGAEEGTPPNPKRWQNGGCLPFLCWGAGEEAKLVPPQSSQPRSRQRAERGRKALGKTA